jgi:predicted N-formylglutamate amidohydrolase
VAISIPDGSCVIVTCEHGGNRVPRDLAPLFRGMRRTLHSHRGYDAGALVMARRLARAFDAPLVASTTSRLVVDLNRSLDNPAVWSAVTRTLPPASRERIVARHYLPYRQKVEALVASAREARRQVIHLSSHSFTPVLDGQRREADVGLLYDPARPGEAKLCAAIRATLREREPSLRVRRNYPYAGTSDGLASWLRTRFAPAGYAGIEIEVNQAIVARAPPEWRWLREALVGAIASALA